MSIVTAGQGNFASEWALAINFGLIERVTSAGERFRYNPTADTDVARGTALVAAINAVTSGDTVMVHSGEYDLGGSGLLTTESFDLVGIGMPRITTLIPSVDNSSGFKFGIESGTNNVSGVSFRTNATEAAYVSGNFYNVWIAGAGVVEGCVFVLNSTVTSPLGGEPKNYVHLGASSQRIESCTFLTIGDATVKPYHGAFHDSGGDSATLWTSAVRCNFLSQNAHEAYFVSPPTMKECVGNQPSKFNLSQIGLYEVRSLVGDFASDVLVDSFYNEFVLDMGNGETRFSAFVEVGTDWRTVFQVDDAQLGDQNTDGYTIEITASSAIPSWGANQFYYHATIRGEVAVVIAEENNLSAAPSNLRYVADDGGGVGVFQIQESAGTKAGVYGSVRFRPTTRAGAIQSPAGGTQFGKQIQFFDISE